MTQMDDNTEVATLWATALSDPNEANIAALGEVLADDVSTTSALGATEGKAAVVGGFGRSPIAALFAAGTWTEPVADGDAYAMTCTFPAGSQVGGVTVRVAVNDDHRITAVDTAVVQAPPPVAVPVALTQEVKDAVGAALTDRNVFMVAYVDAGGRAHLSLRGSVQTWSDDQLAIWIRDPGGGLLGAIPDNPNLTLWYRNVTSRTNYQFYGRATAVTEGELRDKIYDTTPEGEKMLDAQKRGVGVMVDIDRVEGRDASGAVLMDRSAST